jgi:vacuolar protein sorting-associated protein IST1
MAQKKDTAVSISSRREMSVLLSQSREASARIRVENIIQTDICVELMEILELYAELLLARAGLLDARDKDKDTSAKIGGAGAGVPDTGLEEAAASIIYAAPRLPREVRELGVVRGLLVERFGKEFAVRCAGEGGGGLVPERVVEKLKVGAPSRELVEAYLREIARTYGVEWPRQKEGGEEAEEEREERDKELGLLEGEVDEEEGEEAEEEAAARDADGDGDDNQGEDAPVDRIAAALSTPMQKQKKKTNLGRPFERQDLSRATPPRDLAPKAAKSPISVAPPAPRSDNPSPKIRLPGGEEVEKTTHHHQHHTQRPPAAAAAKNKNNSNVTVVGGKIPDVDELAKRFSQLKR